jgi:cleavage and polyadenylation specificity factor subunit 1
VKLILDFTIFFLNRSKGNLRAFPMHIDGPIKTFAEFNNDNCRNGYLYFNQKDDLRISVMPSKRILDTPWPLQKIPFKQTGRILLFSSPISEMSIAAAADVQPRWTSLFYMYSLSFFSAFLMLSCRKQGNIL